MIFNLLATTDSLILYMHVRFYRLKGEDTNLQYTFQSIDRSQRYPLGVKTTYRAYVQDHVFELNRKDDSSDPLCLGLEPWLTHVHTFPTDQ